MADNGDAMRAATAARVGLLLVRLRLSGARHPGAVGRAVRESSGRRTGVRGRRAGAGALRAAGAPV